MQKEYIIDAKDKKLGRVASNAALLLRGKGSADFLPNRTSFPKVIVKNADALALNEKRLSENSFARYSGYPSGRKLTSALAVARADVGELIRKTIWGMLPKNKLRARMIKSLIIYKGENN